MHRGIQRRGGRYRGDHARQPRQPASVEEIRADDKQSNSINDRLGQPHNETIIDETVISDDIGKNPTDEAWVINMSHKNLGSERWSKMKQDWRGKIRVLHRFSAVDAGGARGCGYSHLKLGCLKCSWLPALADAAHSMGWQESQETKSLTKTVYTLEDDAVLASLDASERWAQAIANLPGDFDVLLGGVHYALTSGFSTNICGDALISYPIRIAPNLVKLGEFSGTQQCLFKATAYAKLLFFLSPNCQQVNIDRFMGALAAQGRLHVYCVIPFTTTQRPGRSHLRSGISDDTQLFAKAEAHLLSLPIASSEVIALVTGGSAVGVRTSITPTNVRLTFASIDGTTMYAVV